MLYLYKIFAGLISTFYKNLANISRFKVYYDNYDFPFIITLASAQII